MLVQVERAAEPEAGLRVVAEAAFDHAAVEVLGRVARPEPEGALREVQRLTAVAGPRERPSSDVAVVRGAIGTRETDEDKHVPEPRALVDVEEPGLRVCLDAARTRAGADSRGRPRRNRAFRGRSDYGFGSPFVSSKPRFGSWACGNAQR